MNGPVNDDTKRRGGWQLFKMLRDSTRVTIRTGFTEPFHARGTRNGIANSGSHGWHPEFEARMAALLEQVA